MTQKVTFKYKIWKLYLGFHFLSEPSNKQIEPNRHTNKLQDIPKNPMKISYICLKYLFVNHNIQLAKRYDVSIIAS